MLHRCLSAVVKVLLVGAVVLSVGWALSEARPRKSRIDAKVEKIVEREEEAPLLREARPAPPLPNRPLPPTLRAEPPPPPKPTIAHLSGRIVDEDGNPRSDAKADLDLGDVCIWIHVDSEGRFSADLAPGSYSVSAVDDHDNASVTQPLDLHPGEELRDLVLELHHPEENRYED